ncbi:hypothetical protein BO71DRAFT_399955 [Aspergillus ellipticus CBS 707.79]|uniref:Uncharacterized protein n=1 Tax=Aspergillus ellipticus CBS 707.79 TaxID=1448320 RepID=A0A319D6P9_9EURO|nr:hypothetical protein BO71DRAFT_399955 [Aspergillus ellipticus CBS 707.79]
MVCLKLDTGDGKRARLLGKEGSIYAFSGAGCSLGGVASLRHVRLRPSHGASGLTVPLPHRVGEAAGRRVT